MNYKKEINFSAFSYFRKPLQKDALKVLSFFVHKPSHLLTQKEICELLRIPNYKLYKDHAIALDERKIIKKEEGNFKISFYERDLSGMEKTRHPLVFRNKVDEVDIDTKIKNNKMIRRYYIKLDSIYNGEESTTLGPFLSYENCLLLLEYIKDFDKLFDIYFKKEWSRLYEEQKKEEKRA